MTPITETRPPQTAELYTLDFVQKTAEQQDLQPPLTQEEAVAVHGLLNHSKIACGDKTDSELRFDIVKAAHDAQIGASVDPRMLQLNRFLKSFRLG